MSPPSDPEPERDAQPAHDSSETWQRAYRRAEESLLGGARRYTREDVEPATGVPLHRTVPLWHALGFATTPAGVVSFTDEDLTAVRLADALLTNGAVDESEQIAIARTLGQSMARLAEWQAGLLRRMIVERGVQDDPDAVLDVVRTLTPVLERLQAYAWRRHMAVTAERMLAALPQVGDGSPDGAAVDDDPVVVGFADIVGFTALSRQIGDGELRALLERFETAASDAVVRHGGRVVKNLGDEVMFAIDDPSAAAETALTFKEELGGRDSDIELRIGLARGEVLARYGDLFGPVVNLASRLTSHARPGTILLDQAMATAVRDIEGYRVRRVRPTSVRGYRNLRPYSLRRM